MVRCYRKLGEMDKAILYIDKATELYYLHNKSDHELYLAILYNRSVILTDLGEYEKSIDSLWKSIDLSKNSINHDSTSALIYNTMGRIYSRKGELDSAMLYLTKAIYSKSKGMLYPDYELAVFYKNLGGIYARKGDFKEALKYTVRYRSIHQK